MLPTSAPFPPGWPLESDWSDVLRTSLETTSFQSLQAWIAGERQRAVVFPSAEEVFQAFCLTSFADTKVVIIGQDPYHGPNQAHGLSFSVREGNPLPPSLKNILRELADDLNLTQPTKGDLTHWAEQGVLMLNSVLTVGEGEANSHAKKGWEVFTDSVVHQLGSQRENLVVFVLWGKPAEKKSVLIGNAHPQILSPHPSPLSAHRGFFGSRPFSRINQFLIQLGKTPIDWQIS